MSLEVEQKVDLSSWGLEQFGPDEFAELARKKTEIAMQVMIDDAVKRGVVTWVIKDRIEGYLCLEVSGNDNVYIHFDLTKLIIDEINDNDEEEIDIIEANIEKMKEAIAIRRERIARRR